MPTTSSSARFGATLALALVALIPVATLAADATNTIAAPIAPPTAEELQHLVIRDTQAGSGDEAKLGNIVDVNYTGWIYDPYAPNLHGRQFDSSAGKGTFGFMLGVGDVIPGWDRGVVGMKAGGKRTLIIPPNLAYGQRGNSDIPPGSTLIFDIELVKLK